MFEMRPYQADAVKAAMDWIKVCTDPCLIEAVTAAGKSLIAANIIRQIAQLSGKKVLCLAPSRELVFQNAEKYRAYGEPCSIYCAGLGKKEMVHSAVFGTPKSVENAVARFGSQFAAVIIDEAHYAITGGVKRIIDRMRKANPLLRVIGMTATPFTIGGGYIFRNWPDGTQNDETTSRDPFFHTCVYRITGHELLDQGFITPFTISDHEEGYDTSSLKKKPSGKWDEETVNQVFVGRGRKTSKIVADIVERSRGRDGIMIFAATVQHANEVMESLPPSISAIVTGDTDKAERERILQATKEKRIRYLVNVATLTTGVDITHIDVVAIVRATESPGLFLQMLGRGLRLDPGKTDCLLLDYAENIDRHFPHGDVFTPEIKARSATKGDGMQVACPLCNHTNTFGARKNDEGYDVDSEGYFTDLAGSRIEVAEGKPLPAHYGRRCQGEAIVAGKHVQCSHKWSFKECPECQHENDIAARYCTGCKAEIIDPNEKLKEIATKMANDPYRTRFATVTGWQVRRWPSSKDNTDSLRVDYYFDENPTVVSEWYPSPDRDRWSASRWSTFCSRHWGRNLKDISEVIESYPVARPPTRVAYRKKPGSKFFNVITVD